MRIRTWAISLETKSTRLNVLNGRWIKGRRRFLHDQRAVLTELDTSEIYFCQSREGFVVMENPEGEVCVEPLIPGNVLYVPPCWVHRSVCASRQEDLVTFFAYPGNAGHDYGTIEKQEFRKLVG